MLVDIQNNAKHNINDGLPTFLSRIAMHMMALYDYELALFVMLTPLIERMMRITGLLDTFYTCKLCLFWYLLAQDLLDQFFSLQSGHPYLQALSLRTPLAQPYCRVDIGLRMASSFLTPLHILDLSILESIDGPMYQH